MTEALLRDKENTQRGTVFIQVVKFMVAGLINTVVDFLVLNLLIIFVSENPTTVIYIFFKTLSFVAALVCSFILNKYWVFANDGSVSRPNQKTIFVVVSTLAFLMNVAVAAVVFSIATHSSVVLLTRSSVAENIGALAGTLAVLVWNFLFYKFVVFKG